MAETLKAKTDLDVSVPLADVRQEREEWAAYLAKKDFLAQIGGPLVDSSRVMEMSLRDSAFTAYLDYKVPATKGMPERECCIAVIAELVAKAMAQAETSRQQATIAQLAKKRSELQPVSTSEQPAPKNRLGTWVYPAIVLLWMSAILPKSRHRAQKRPQQFAEVLFAPRVGLEPTTP